MCTGQTKGGTSVEEQTTGGIPSEGSITGGAPGEEDFVDKLPISTKWAKASVGSKLNVESSETPNMELSKRGTGLEERIHMKGPMQNFEAQEEKEPNQGKAPRDVDAPNSHSGKNPIESLHPKELKTLENLDRLF